MFCKAGGILSWSLQQDSHRSYFRTPVELLVTRWRSCGFGDASAPSTSCYHPHHYWWALQRVTSFAFTFSHCRLTSLEIRTLKVTQSEPVISGARFIQVRRGIANIQYMKLFRCLMHLIYYGLLNCFTTFGVDTIVDKSVYCVWLRRKHYITLIAVNAHQIKNINKFKLSICAWTNHFLSIMHCLWNVLKKYKAAGNVNV